MKVSVMRTVIVAIAGWIELVCTAVSCKFVSQTGLSLAGITVRQPKPANGEPSSITVKMAVAQSV